MFAVYVNMRAKIKKTTRPRHSLTLTMSWLAGISLLLYSTPIMSYPNEITQTRHFSINHSIDLTNSSLRLNLVIHNSPFPITLSYNSRSLHSGVFGFGWCSDFDWKVSSDRAFHCGNQKDVEIVKTVFGYRIQVEDKTIVLTPKGELLGVSFPTSVNNEKLAILTPKTTQFLTKLFQNHRVITLKTSSSGVELNQTKFRIEGLNLTSVENEDSSLSLKYDSFHNLTQAIGKTAYLSIDYNENNDSVEILESEKCKSSYTWSSDLLSVNKHCKDNKPIAFSMKRTSRLLTSFNTQQTNLNLTYSPDGRISSLKNHTKEVHLKYQDSGGPSSIHFPGVGSLRIEYGPEGQVERAISPQGQEAAREIRGFFNTTIVEAQRANNIIKQMGGLQ